MSPRPVKATSTSKDLTARFGRRVAELRTKSKMSQAEMALLLGIDRSFISDMERGKRSCSVPMAEVLAVGFNVTLSELFHGL